MDIKPLAERRPLKKYGRFSFKMVVNWVALWVLVQVATFIILPDSVFDSWWASFLVILATGFVTYWCVGAMHRRRTG